MVISVRARGVALILMLGAIFVVRGILVETGVDRAPENGPALSKDSDDVAEPEHAVERTEATPSSSAPPAVADVARENANTAPVGTGEIRGVVELAASRQGLAGVTIRITSVTARGDASGVDRRPRPTVAEDAPFAHETITDASGKYAFSGLPLGRWTIEASSPTHSVEARADLSPIVETGSVRNFVARPVGLATIVARLPKGRSAEVFTIEIDPALRPRRTEVLTRKDGDPRIVLEPGEYELRVKVTREQCEANGVTSVCNSEPKKVVIAPGDQPSIEFELLPSLKISGAVRFTEATASPYIVVQCVRVASGEVADRERFEDLASIRREVAHVGGPNYRFDDLTAGRYLVGLSRGLLLPVVTHVAIDLSDRDAIQDFEIPALDPSEYAEVTVTDPEGRPVEGASFSYRHRLGGFGPADSISVGPGRYRVLFGSQEIKMFRAAPQDSGLRYSANHAVLGTVSIDVPRQPTELHFQYSATATLEVRIVGYAGAPLAGRIELTLGDVLADDDMAGRIEETLKEEPLRPDVHGVARLGPVAAGTRRLTVKKVDAKAGSTKLVLVRESVDLKPGLNELTLTLPELHDLRVEVTGGVAGDPLAASLSGDQIHETREALATNVTFSELPSGRYDLLVSSRERSAFASVTLNGDSIVNLTVKEPNAYLMQALWCYPELSDIALKDGDLIVGIDGVPFAGLDALKLALTAAAASERVRLSVLRRGEKLELELVSPSFLNPSKSQAGRPVGY